MARPSSSWALTASLVVAVVLAVMSFFYLTSASESPAPEASPLRSDAPSVSVQAPFDRLIWQDVRAVLIDSVPRPDPWSRVERVLPESTLADRSKEIFRLTRQPRPPVGELYVLDVNGDGSDDVIHDGQIVGGLQFTTVYLRSPDDALRMTTRVRGNALDVRFTNNRDTLHLRTAYVSGRPTQTQVIDERALPLPESLANASTDVDGEEAAREIPETLRRRIVMPVWTRPPNPAQCDTTPAPISFSDPTTLRTAPVQDDTTVRRAYEFEGSAMAESLAVSTGTSGPIGLRVGTRLAVVEAGTTGQRWCTQPKAPPESATWAFVVTDPAPLPAWHLPLRFSTPFHDDPNAPPGDIAWAGWVPLQTTSPAK